MGQLCRTKITFQSLHKYLSSRVPGNEAKLLAPVIIVYMASSRSVHTMRKVTEVTSTSSHSTRGPHRTTVITLCL